MKYSQLFLNRLIDKSLEINEAGVKYVDILQEEKDRGTTKKTKDYKPYYLRFPWKNRELQQKWIKYVEKEVRKMQPNDTEDKIKLDIDFLDMLCSLSELDLLEKEIDIKNTPLKEEAI